MHRDLATLTSQTFDLVVVGGGVYGLTVACDAAQRGLSVALIDQHDFGSGTSFNHLRTIHGGLRYLQTLDISRSRESIRERRTLARIAPHAVQPLPFVLPLYRSLFKGRLAMRSGFWLDRIVGFDRNRDVPPTHVLPPGRLLSKQEVADHYPGIRRRELTGAARWFDYVTTEADRLTFSWALAAVSHGAVLVNYVGAEALLADGRRVVGVKSRDHRTGAAVDISARLTLNATGGSIETLLRPLGLSAGVPVMRAMNLVTTRDAGDAALGGVSTSGRTFFLVPWRGKALFGTWESGRTVEPGDRSVRESDVSAFIAELNQAFPALELTCDEVSLVHAGNVPAVITPAGATLQGREQVRDHMEQGVDGLVSLAGTKYTTARAVAERVTTLLLKKLGRASVPAKTAVTPLPGGDISSPYDLIAAARREFDAQLPSDTLPHLIGAYGSRFREVAELGRTRADWRTRLSKTSPVIGAELVWAARHEMTETLSDAVIRRTPLGVLGDPGEAASASAAAIIGSELGWSAERTAMELADLRRFFSARQI